MLVEANGTKLMEAFHKSVIDLCNEIEEKAEWINNNDPDPNRTTNYMVDKKLREWFNKGGNMGY